MGRAAGVIRQIVDQTEVADGRRVFSYLAKEPETNLITADGEVADGVAVALKNGNKGVAGITDAVLKERRQGVAGIADRQPAAGALLIHRKIIGMVVIPIQSVSFAAAARPSAAIAI